MTDLTQQFQDAQTEADAQIKALDLRVTNAEARMNAALLTAHEQVVALEAAQATSENAGHQAALQQGIDAVNRITAEIKATQPDPPTPAPDPAPAPPAGTVVTGEIVSGPIPTEPPAL